MSVTLQVIILFYLLLRIISFIPEKVKRINILINKGVKGLTHYMIDAAIEHENKLLENAYLVPDHWVKAMYVIVTITVAIFDTLTVIVILHTIISI